VQTVELKFPGVTILQEVKFPIFLLIFAWALYNSAAYDLSEKDIKNL